jgi:V8-like Glu-specific endopeptidase
MQNLLDVEMSEESLEIEEIQSYWTKENMESAIPIEIPMLDELTPPIQWTQDGIMSSMEAVAPDHDYDNIIEDLEKVLPTAGFTTSLVPILNYRLLPWCPVGKLYMVFGNKNYQGTAWAISGSESGIFTAGHCVFDNGLGGGSGAGWATKVKFEAQYYDGRSAGTWYMRKLYTLKGWTSRSGFQYDLGCCLATSKIRPTTGALGWRANYPPNQGSYISIGYPASPVSGYNFDGQKMWQSIGNYINGSSSFVQMHNNMTGGCSGGPWVINNSNFQVNGINSFKRNPNTVYSPYFGNGFLKLFDEIKSI